MNLTGYCLITKLNSAHCVWGFCLKVYDFVNPDASLAVTMRVAIGLEIVSRLPAGIVTKSQMALSSMSPAHKPQIFRNSTIEALIADSKFLAIFLLSFGHRLTAIGTALMCLHCINRTNYAQGQSETDMRK